LLLMALAKQQTEAILRHAHRASYLKRRGMFVRRTGPLITPKMISLFEGLHRLVVL
jgi:hypothetical protein